TIPCFCSGPVRRPACGDLRIRSPPAAARTAYTVARTLVMTSLDLFRLDGQSAVVTGGAGGLGAAIARGLAEAGASVCVADSTARQGALVAEELVRAGHRALALEVDVASPDGVERMAADVEA